jgi:hypothetical protein
LEIVLILTIGVRFEPNGAYATNHFGCTRWYTLVTCLKWQLDLICYETVLILMHDRCSVCIKRTIGSEIVLYAPDGTPR